MSGIGVMRLSLTYKLQYASMCHSPFGSCRRIIPRGSHHELQFSDAALVNGTASHAFELDDYRNAKLHAGAVVVPAALALAEKLEASGEGLQPVRGTPGHFLRVIQRTVEKWRKVVKHAKVTTAN